MNSDDFHRQVELLINDLDFGDITPEEFEAEYEELLEQLDDAS